MQSGVFLRFDPADAGKALAHQGDEEQAAVINAMADELRIACQDERRLEMQHCYISDKLDRHGKQLILVLAEFIRLREESAA